MKINLPIPNIDPCPFCDNTDVQLHTPMFGGYKFVECTKCLSTGPKSVNEKYAIDWWNKLLKKDTLTTTQRIVNEVLRAPESSKKAKTAAGSALSQSRLKRPRRR